MKRKLLLKKDPLEDLYSRNCLRNGRALAKVGFGVRTYKSTPTRDGEAFGYKLTLRGHDIAWVANTGTGGPTSISWRPAGKEVTLLSVEGKHLWEDTLPTLLPFMFNGYETKINTDIAAVALATWCGYRDFLWKNTNNEWVFFMHEEDIYAEDHCSVPKNILTTNELVQAYRKSHLPEDHVWVNDNPEFKRLQAKATKLV